MSTSSNTTSDEEFKNTLNSLSIQAKRNAKILVAIFLLGIAIMSYIIYNFPELKEEEKNAIFQFPRTPENLKRFVLQRCRENYWRSSARGLCFTAQSHRSTNINVKCCTTVQGEKTRVGWVCNETQVGLRASRCT